MKNLCCVFIFFLIFLFASCAMNSGIKEIRYANEGQIFVYLSSSQEPSTDITFIISGMSFMNKDGLWIDVSMKPRTINSVKLSGNQIKLRDFYLPENKYKKIKLMVTEANLKHDDKKHSLSLPETVNNQGEIHGELLVDIDFNVFYHESLCLFINWDINSAIVDKYLFQPRLVAKPQGLEIKNILIYVSNEGSNCVTVIDRQEDFVVGTIAVGEAPRGITASSDGTKIYVANSGSNSISVIDTSVNRVKATIDNWGYSPEELALSGDDNILFVTNPDSNNVSVIDLASNMVVNRINVGEKPIDIVADTERRKIYVSNYYSLSISVVNMDTRAVEKTINLSSNPKYLALCDDRLYIGNESINDIYIVYIPYSSSNSIDTVNIGSRSERLICGLANRVYAGNIAFDEIYFLHTKSGVITKNISVGGSPAGMDIDAMRRKLYVANKSSGDVSVIDIKTERVIKTVPVGKKPHDIVLVAE